IVLIELLICVLVAYLAARPFALLAYLRAVHAAQGEYFKAYMPFTMPTTTWKTSDTYEDGTSAPSSFQEQQVALLDLVQQQNTNQMILGMPGVGKTTALRVYQHSA